MATLATEFAHAMETSVAVIQSHAERLESSATDGQERSRMRTIREQIDRLSQIIQALLNTANRRETTRVPVSIAAVLDNALAFLADKFHRNGVQVDRQLGLFRRFAEMGRSCSSSS